MDINATLLGQMITFAIFVLFTMKIVWPVLNKVLVERQKKIAAGLAAAEKGHKTLFDAKEEAEACLHDAKKQSEDIISNANKRAVNILENSRSDAVKERDSIINSGRRQIEQELNQAKKNLCNQVSKLIIMGAEKILSRTIDYKDHRDLIESFSKKIS